MVRESETQGDDVSGLVTTNVAASPGRPSLYLGIPSIPHQVRVEPYCFSY